MLMRPMRAPDPVPAPAALEAWSRSFLASAAPEIRDLLLADSRIVSYPPGAFLSAGNGRDYKAALVHSGILRALITTWEGREATTRYLTAGQISGVPAMLTLKAPSSLQALTYCEVSLLNQDTFRRLMEARADLCYLVAVYLAESAYEVMMYLEGNAFGSVQQRVSTHLLAMAVPTSRGLLVQTDQTELANAIGSVREVVARALKRLSDTGAIRRSRRQIWIEDPSLLRSLASVPPLRH